MQTKDLRDLLLLAAIWGGSFLFMRLAVNDFGPVAFIEMRIGISAIFLLILSAFMGKLDALKTHWKAISVCGVFNVALPFFCFAYAAQTVPAGTLAVINAMVPLCGALIARVWLHERLTWLRALGLLIGFAGILVLVWEDLSFHANGSGWPVLVALGAPFFYGIAACYTTKYLKGVDPIACATGSVTASALLLLPLAIWTWPATPISNVAWGSAVAVAILCTGIAYIIFFGLIARVGATKAITVTFLVPVFGIFWGALLLDEAITTAVVTGAAIVLCGTLLATGILERRRTVVEA
ncbi:DMT family transporter [Candidimonas sp. SYP-B2681]|uniref:DMT family transporter n=1 Tax=Candidimonas sp. SYP-B2681 TaxID=2497686 RepID=UPI000F898799|nr:DMT family transporter [Candidimonas sp. SYP-B2681]RTZ43248.1 DMT family transporter [Candidimonas sp. SYP-B2681]